MASEMASNGFEMDSISGRFSFSFDWDSIGDG